MSLLMELKLRKNDHKGGWKNLTRTQLMAFLDEEVQEIREALAAGDPLDIAQECADVCNYAMMIADNEGGL